MFGALHIEPTFSDLSMIKAKTSDTSEIVYIPYSVCEDRKGILNTFSLII